MSEYSAPTHAADDWEHDDGPVLWWRFPIEEPPYCGTPLDTDFYSDYYTHWTRIVLPDDSAYRSAPKAPDA